jgi:hypothetical protein
MLVPKQEQAQSHIGDRDSLQKQLLEKLGQDNIEWVAKTLEKNAALFLPQFIIESVSPHKIEVAYALYCHRGLRKFLKSKENDSVLVVAYRINDAAMVRYCLSLEAEKKKINANVDHIPALFAAIDSLNVQQVQELLGAGANINIVGEDLDEDGNMVRMSAGHRAIRTNDIDMVKCIFKSPHFNCQRSFSSLGSVLYTSCKMVSKVKGENQRKKAEAIFKFIVENLPKNAKTAALYAEHINGNTILTFALVEARECAAVLIDLGLGVFDLDANQRSPLYWARARHEKGLEANLKNSYTNNIGMILDLFLRPDRRVYQVVKNTTHITLVLPMVAEWTELRQKIFKALETKINHEKLSYKELRHILKQLESPKSPLRQFFDLGYGKHFWQGNSPWPAQFEPLKNQIKSRLASSTSVMVYETPSEYRLEN